MFHVKHFRVDREGLLEDFVEHKQERRKCNESSQGKGYDKNGSLSAVCPYTASLGHFCGGVYAGHYRLWLGHHCGATVDAFLRSEAGYSAHVCCGFIYEHHAGISCPQGCAVQTDWRTFRRLSIGTARRTLDIYAPIYMLPALVVGLLLGNAAAHHVSVKLFRFMIFFMLYFICAYMFYSLLVG